MCCTRTCTENDRSRRRGENKQEGERARTASGVACAASSFLVRGFFVGAEPSSGPASSCGAPADGADVEGRARATPAADEGSSTLLDELVRVLGVVPPLVGAVEGFEPATSFSPTRNRSYASSGRPESASEPTLSKHTQEWMVNKTGAI